ncbi:MAG: ATP-binding cassette domain-containing protein [Gammaproteobacteria bacterium]
MNDELNPAGESSQVLACKGLGKQFRDVGAPLTILADVSLTMTRGDTLAIIGESGSGKSTLLHLLAGLEKPTHGEVFHGTTALAELSEADRSRLRNQHLGFVYQFHHLLAEFSAQENVAMPLLIRGESRKRALSAATEVLALVGLEQRITHRPAQLSGGERQRAAIARALVTEPQAILADEPTGNLDAKTAESTWQVLETANRQLNVALLIVTHARALAQRLDRVCELEGGELVEVMT